MGRVKVKPVMNGVREVLKSPGVTEMLESQAKVAAARCNQMCSAQMRNAGAEYVASTKTLKYSAAGLVSCGGEEDGKFARIDNYRNNTLKKGCGI